MYFSLNTRPPAAHRINPSVSVAHSLTGMDRQRVDIKRRVRTVWPITNMDITAGLKIYIEEEQTVILDKSLTTGRETV